MGFGLGSGFGLGRVRVRRGPGLGLDCVVVEGLLHVGVHRELEHKVTHLAGGGREAGVGGGGGCKR